jgi:enoyl-CoA hydratase/carnithine racemase
MTKQQYTTVTVDEGERICWVTIDRSVDRNSINSTLMRELADLLGELEETPTRAVVFTGSGDTHFIGGADGVEMMQCDPDGAKSFSRRIQQLFERLESSPLITVAGINGLCFGGGFELAMACDLRIACDGAKIGLPEVKVGLIPGGGGTQRLTRLVGFGRALHMILSGTLYKASEALELGLIHAVTTREKLVDDVEALLGPILRNPRYALTHAKSSVYASSLGPMEIGLTVESEQFSRCFEHTFFKDLMQDQLSKGVLTTTEDVSQLLDETRRS